MGSGTLGTEHGSPLNYNVPGLVSRLGDLTLPTTGTGQPTRESRLRSPVGTSSVPRPSRRSAGTDSLDQMAVSAAAATPPADHDDARLLRKNTVAGGSYAPLSQIRHSPGMRTKCVLAFVLASIGLCPAGPAAASPVSYRVVGGTAVPAIASFPFQAALYIRGSSGVFGQYQTLAFCGGVIIDPVQIVTAAHCVTDDKTGRPVMPAQVTVVSGTATLPPAVPTSPVAAAIAIDPNYDASTADYDVAVVTLPAPLYSGAPRADGAVPVAPIPLINPTLAAEFADPNASPAPVAVLSGWGETRPLAIGAPDDSPALPPQLEAALVHLVPARTCSAEYALLAGAGVPSITSRMLCAGEPNGSVDACSGDSGGPLVVDINNPASPPSDYVLAGLIDFGAGCAQAGYPGVYVRVAAAEISSFIAQQAAAAGQQLTPAPTPVGPAPTRRAAAAAMASLSSATGRVRSRVAQVAVHCATAICTGSLTLRTTTTVGLARFVIAANSTAKVPVRITPTGKRLLDRHKHRLRTVATLRTTGAPATQKAFTITD